MLESKLGSVAACAATSARHEPQGRKKVSSYRIVVMTTNLPRRRQERTTRPRALRDAQECQNCKVAKTIGKSTSGYVVAGSDKGHHAVDTPHYYDVTPCDEHRAAIEASADHTY